MGGAKSKTFVGAAARNVLARRQQDMDAVSKVSISSPAVASSTPSISTGQTFETKGPKPETLSPSEISNNNIGDHQQFHGEEPTQHVLHQEHSSPLNPDILKEVSKWTVRKTTNKVDSHWKTIFFIS